MFAGLGLVEINLDILDIFFVLFKLCVSFVLSVEVAEHFVVNPELKRLSLLNHIEGEPVQSERVLKRHIASYFCLVHYLSVTSYLDFARHE